MMPMGGENVPPIDTEMNPENEAQFETNDFDKSSEFDTNFDAGVEADENTDPKKYIQQLTGKLSQTLNSYNNENGEPDTELGKYVLGMLIKQGTKGMDETDRKEIIKKINTNNSNENNEDADNDEDFDDLDNSVSDINNMQMESKTIRCTKKQIFENFGIAMSDTNNTNTSKEIDTKISNDTIRNRRTRPFEAPKKFKE